MSNELMTVTSVAELSNKDLKKNCNTILKELTKVNKSAWAIAHMYCSIVEAEQWKDDFETFKDFAEYVNVKRATLFLYSKAATISNILKDSEIYKDIESVITVSKMIELAMKKNNCRLDKRRLRIEITGQAPKGKKNKQSE